MMRYLAAIVLLHAQVITMGHRAVHGGGSCTPLTGLALQYIGSSGASCSGTCSGGGTISSWTDTVTSDAAVAGGGTPITYTISSIGGKPGLTFSSSSTGYLAPATPIAVTAPDVTFVAIVKPTVLSGYPSIMGGGGGAFQWAFDSSGHVNFIKSFVAFIATGTATYTAGQNAAIAIHYNTSTGAYNMWTCSGGTCSTDAAGTDVTTFTSITDMGASSGNYFFGDIDELDEYTGSSYSTFVSTFAAYAQGCYGI